MSEKYHIGLGGTVRKCNASVRPCKYGEARHYETPEAARQAVEEINTKETLITIDKSGYISQIPKEWDEDEAAITLEVFREKREQARTEGIRNDIAARPETKAPREALKRNGFKEMQVGSFFNSTETDDSVESAQVHNWGVSYSYRNGLKDNVPGAEIMAHEHKGKHVMQHQTIGTRHSLEQAKEYAKNLEKGLKVAEKAARRMNESIEAAAVVNPDGKTTLFEIPPAHTPIKASEAKKPEIFKDDRGIRIERTSSEDAGKPTMSISADRNGKIETVISTSGSGSMSYENMRKYIADLKMTIAAAESMENKVKSGEVKLNPWL